VSEKISSSAEFSRVIDPLRSTAIRPTLIRSTIDSLESLKFQLGGAVFLFLIEQAVLYCD